MTALEFRALTDDPEDPTPNFDAGRSEFDTNPGDGEYRCEVCGLTISTPSGRKPRVMLCEEHRATKGKTGDTPSTKGQARSHAKIAGGMTALHTILGIGVGGLYIPTRDEVWLRDKDVIHANAEGIGEAWAKVTDTDPKLRKAVEQFLDKIGYLTLAAAYAPAAVGIVTNHTMAQQAKRAEQARVRTVPTQPAA